MTESSPRPKNSFVELKPKNNAEVIDRLRRVKEACGHGKKLMPVARALDAMIKTVSGLDGNIVTQYEEGSEVPSEAYKGVHHQAERGRRVLEIILGRKGGVYRALREVLKRKEGPGQMDRSAKMGLPDLLEGGDFL